jgi:uncharacterized protein YndB with AHSA1/START domain
MKNNSVTLHRVLKTTPEKLFRAFTNPAAIASWLPPYGFTCTVHEMEVKEGGKYRMSFETFHTGNISFFYGKYQEIRPNEYLRYTDQFEDPNLPGEMTTTIEMKKNVAGTEIRIQQEGIPEAIPSDFCYLGWQESLEKLAKLVEPEIQDV